MPGAERGTAGRGLGIVLALALGLVAVLGAPPARACSCAEPDLSNALAGADDEALVLAQRVDADGGPDGELRVLRTLAGGPVVGPVQARFDDGGSCDPWVAGGAVAGLLLAREGEAWTTTVCGMVSVGDALAAVGDPPQVAPDAGPPTLLLVGAFGGAHVAAVDAAGRVAAWAGDEGRGVAAGTCPGGSVVVEVSSSPDGHLALHRWSLPGLEPAGPSVELGTERAWNAAVRCLDPDGDRVLVALPAYGEPGTLGVVDGDVADLRPAPVEAVDAAGGTIAAIVGEPGDRFSSPTLATVTDAGELVELTRHDGINFDRIAVAPDGRHVLAAGYPDGETPGDALVMAATDGSSTATLQREGYHMIGWLGPERAWLRPEPTGAFGAVQPRVDLVDTTLAPAGTADVGSGQHLVGLPDGAILRFGSAPPSVVRDDAVRQVADVRLTDTTLVVPLDAGAVLTEAAAEEPTASPVAEEPIATTGRDVTGAGAGRWPWLVGLAVAGALGLLFAGRRR